MKKLLSLLFTAALLLQLCACGGGEGKAEVYDPVTWDKNTGITEGIDSATVTGTEPVTKGDFLLMLANFSEKVMKFNLNGYIYTSPIYTDIAADSPLSRAAVWCGAWHIMEAKEDGSLGASAAISPEELSAAVYNYIKVWLEDGTYTETAAKSLVGTAESYSYTDIIDLLHNIMLYAEATDSCNRQYAHMKRGVNIWTWDNSLYGDRVSGADSTLYKEIWDSGFDHVRLVWDATDYETRDPELFSYEYDYGTDSFTIILKQERYDSAFNAATLADKAGLTSIIDLHGVLFPENTDDKLDPNEEPQLFIDLWAAIAEHLKELPLTVMFELCNETYIEPETVEKTIDAIRATGGNNAQRTVIVYSYHWKVGDEIIDIGKYNNDPTVMWDIHNYEPFPFAMNTSTGEFDENGLPIPKTPFGEEGSKQRENIVKQMTARMLSGQELALKTGQKVWFGEYGVQGDAGADREPYLTSYMDNMYDLGLYSTCYWCFGYHGNEKIMKPFGDSWVMEIGSFGTTDESGSPKIYWAEDIMRAIFS